MSIVIGTRSLAKEVTFIWTANTEPITGYKLYYSTGEESGPPYDGTGVVEGDSPISIDKTTTATVNVANDKYYEFTLTAYNNVGESDYSDTAIVTPDMKAPIILIMGQI